MGTDRPPIIFYAFDLLQLDGKDLKALPIEERNAKLAEPLINQTGALRYSISFTKDIDELLEKAKHLGLEGLIGQRSGSRYEVGKRSGAWVKSNCTWEQEFVIGGYTDPDGARKHFRALLVEFYENKKLKFAGGVGTGLNEDLLRSLSAELNKLHVEDCPFFNVPIPGRSRWDQGLTPADLKRCHWLKPKLVCQVSSRSGRGMTGSRSFSERQN
jgi:bifunctional non-homologous end joining protein LigD